MMRTCWSLLRVSQSPRLVTTRGTHHQRMEEWLKRYLNESRDFNSLSSDQKRYVVELECRTLRECGEQAPEVIPESYWPELLTDNVHERRKLLRFLFLKDFYAQQKVERREQQRVFMQEKARQRADKLKQGERPSSYPGYQTCFSHIAVRQENFLEMGKYVTSNRLGRRLLLDCEFEGEHKKAHLKSMVDQIVMAVGYNKHYELPFAITLCNFTQTGAISRMLDERGVSVSTLDLEVTDKDICEIVPKHKLVYLSPQANQELGQVDDEDDVHVIGALAERPSRPLTFSKALRLGIRTAKFPVDKFVKFCGGSKELTIDQCVNILASNYQSGNDWKTAFKWIPSRKLKREEDTDSWGYQIGLK